MLTVPTLKGSHDLWPLTVMAIDPFRVGDGRDAFRGRCPRLLNRSPAGIKKAHFHSEEIFRSLFRPAFADLMVGATRKLGHYSLPGQLAHCIGGRFEWE